MRSEKTEETCHTGSLAQQKDSYGMCKNGLNTDHTGCGIGTSPTGHCTPGATAATGACYSGDDNLNTCSWGQTPFGGATRQDTCHSGGQAYGCSAGNGENSCDKGQFIYT